MRPSSKQWLYAGLVVMAGLGAARLLSGPRLRKGMRVLLIGDSLAVGMAPHFAALAKEAGIDFKALATVGTRIDQWSANADLKKLLESFQPELVLVSLGTNDEFMQGDAVKKQQPQLEKLLALLTQWPRSRDYGLGAEYIVWIGPPTLPNPPSPGIPKMIQDAAGSVLAPRFSYFHSERLQMPRGPDGIHPNVRGYAGWAGAIWHWLS
jgi:lysophospholipase L1-like esterase